MAKGFKTGGRQKGTPNKTTKALRDVITDAWRHYHESGLFMEDLLALDPDARITVMERYAQFVAPKLKAVDLDLCASTTTLTIEHRLAQLAADNPDNPDNT